MTIIESIILAIVEGLTEFLPVSSTGHMILAEGIMGMKSSDYLSAFTVMIQFGAILSVFVTYMPRFLRFDKGAKEQHHGLSGFNLYWLMFIGCIPAGIMGILLEKHIDALLSRVEVVITMLFVGGIVMLFMDRLFAKDKPQTVTPTKAAIIGCFQCLAMIPGLSRSMATIFGGMQQGLTREQAAEFSFFLAIPTMFGATLLKAYKLYKLHGMSIFSDNWDTLLIGNVVAFLVALLAIKFFIGVVTRYGFKAFGYYRIAVSIVLAILLLAGVSIELQ